MKFTIAPLLLSSVSFASPESKAAKFAKAKFPKAKAAKSAGYVNMCMSTSSMSMSVGPEPPITPTPTAPQPTPEPSLSPTSEPSLSPTSSLCGESITDQKVVLTNDIYCGGPRYFKEFCAVRLDGPQAEIDCNNFMLSQLGVTDGRFSNGICLLNGAKARNCNVQQFNIGILVYNGGEVVESNLSSNNSGIRPSFTQTSTVIIENTDASNNGQIGLGISVTDNQLNAQLIIKGDVTFNSNGSSGIIISQSGNSNLEINVETGATLESCGNTVNDIVGNVNAPATATFSGTGYTCSSKLFSGDGTVDEPVCQPCQ